MTRGLGLGGANGRGGRMGRPGRLAGLSPFLPSFLYFLNQNFREKKEVLEVEYFRKENISEVLIIYTI